MGEIGLSREELIAELEALRKRVEELQRSETQYKNIEAALRESELEKSIILENIFDLVIYRNKNMETVWASKPLADFLGYTHQGIKGRICYKARHNRDKPCDNCWVVEAMETGKIQERENSSPDGRQWYVKCTPIFDNSGNIVGTVEISQDITSRKQADEQLLRSYEQTDKLIKGFINAISSIVERRDPYTAGHQRRVAELAKMIAETMSLPEEKVKQIQTAAFIHDIGKISVPVEILIKPLALTTTEHAIMELHPQTGHDILADIDFPWPVADFILNHHERLNGTGYPGRLSGPNIPLESKIISVADVVEAMASHRPYRPSYGLEKALEEISTHKGILYDSDVVEVCLKLFHDKKFEFSY